MKPLFLFVRPPRPLWPFNGPSTAFWPPLAFASMAAALRDGVPGLRVEIVDAPAMRMGWKTLTQQLERLRPAFVGIGEEAVSCQEGLRIAALAKELDARVVAGGCFFANVAPQVLATRLVDAVVHGEGEATVVELARALMEGDAKGLRSVAGISFVDDGEVVFTGHREPIADLDRLPLPAYDLLPMERYGDRSHHHPRFASIEAGRGCRHGCEFCVLWRQMGRFHGDRIAPHHRVKSPERLLEEIRILADRYGRRYLGWVDPCFNADPATVARLAELLLRENRRIGQSAWVRADSLLRDEERGALDLWCEAGWNEAYLGVERLDASELARLGKGNLHGEVAKAAEILRERHPQVITFGSLIYGLPGDTAESVRAMFREASEMPFDILFFIPLTPLPGTPFWEAGMWDPTGERLRSFNFLPAGGQDARMTELSEAIARSYLFGWNQKRLLQMAESLLSGNARRRGITWNLLRRSLPLMLRTAYRTRTKMAGGMIQPAWYEN